MILLPLDAQARESPQDPLQIRWRERARLRPIEAIAPALRPPFQEETEVQLVAAGVSAPDAIYRFGGAPVPPFHAVPATIEAAGSQTVVLIGFTAMGNYSALVSLDPASGGLGIEVQGPGGDRRRLASGIAPRPTTPFQLCAVMNANMIEAWIDDGEGWRAPLTALIPWTLFDFRIPSTLAAVKPSVGLRGPEGTEARFAMLQSGPFGQAGLRDCRLVTHADGSPYVRDGEVYLTMTALGVGGIGHWAVYAFDPLGFNLRKTALVFVARDDPTDIQADVSGKIVVERGRFLVWTATWGNGRGGDLRLEFQSTGRDVLSGVVVLDRMRPFATSESRRGLACYDIDVVRDRARKKWFVAYAAAPDSLFSTPSEFTVVDVGERLGRLKRVFRTPTEATREGAVISSTPGGYVLTAGSPDDIGCWTLTGRSLGALKLEPPTAGGVVPAWGALLQTAGFGWLLLSSDAETFPGGVGNHGALHVYSA